MEITEYSCCACDGRCLVKCNGKPCACICGKPLEPSWREVRSPEFEKDDPWRHPYYDDDEYIANLTEAQKDEIVRNHFDCRMRNGCPCFLDPDYKCREWKAFCELTGSDGSDFEFDDCWFRSNEHRCLTDYVLWKMKKNEES